MIHKDIFKDVGLFDENLPVCEDYDLWLRICSRYPVLYLRKKLIKKYGGHDDQLSLRFWGMDRFRIQALEKMINDPVLSENYFQHAEHFSRKLSELNVKPKEPAPPKENEKEVESENS